MREPTVTFTRLQLALSYYSTLIIYYFSIINNTQQTCPIPIQPIPIQPWIYVHVKHTKVSGCVSISASSFSVLTYPIVDDIYLMLCRRPFYCTESLYLEDTVEEDNLPSEDEDSTVTTHASAYSKWKCIYLLFLSCICDTYPNTLYFLFNCTDGKKKRKKTSKKKNGTKKSDTKKRKKMGKLIYFTYRIQSYLYPYLVVPYSLWYA